MNQNKRGFNVFGGEMPFIFPPPVPEPPRVWLSISLLFIIFYINIK